MIYSEGLKGKERQLEVCFIFILPCDSAPQFSGLRCRFLWSLAAGGLAVTKVIPYYCLDISAPRAPPKPSDHPERAAFSVSKIIVSKQRKKTSPTSFYLEEKGFRDQQGKNFLSLSISKLKGVGFFSFLFLLLFFFLLFFAFCWSWADKSPEMRKSRGQQLKALV